MFGNVNLKEVVHHEIAPQEISKGSVCYLGGNIVVTLDHKIMKG